MRAHAGDLRLLCGKPYRPVTHNETISPHAFVTLANGSSVTIEGMKRWVALAFVGSALTLSCADDTSSPGNVATGTGTGSSSGTSAGPSPDSGPGPDSTGGDATMGDSTAAPGSSSSGDPTLDGTSTGTPGSSSDTGETVCRGDGECDDDNPCTIDQCVDTACMHDDEADGTACNDGRMDGICDAGECVAAVECKSPADCTDLPPDDDCQERLCDGGECGLDFTPEGEPASAVRQTAGDCQVVVCDGAGGTTMEIDDTDVPDDGNDCTEDVCTAGVPSNPPVGEGTACEAGVCNDSGTCVGCLTADDCAGSDTFCQVRTCVDNTCGVDNTAADTPLPDPDQTANDCQLAVCDGNGNVAQNADDADLPLDDGNDCTAQACNVGVPLFPDEPVDTACDQDGGLFCDGAGACVECNDASQCSGAGECSVDACTDNACVVESAAAGTACDDGQFCTATDECDGAGACVGAGDPCQGADGDGNCSETCDEGANACTGADPDGSACNDGTFCNGTDTCQGGTCSTHAGDPCTGASDGDADCLESCLEGVGGAGSCTAPDPVNTTCDDGLLCTFGDQCDAVGVCQGGPSPCAPTPGDFDCSESCNAATGLCDAPDPAGGSCDDQQFCTATDTCDGAGSCTGTGDPCEGADGDGNCAESCDEIANNCLANDQGGTACDDGLFCTATDVCNGLGACVGSDDPCPGADGDGDCAESCDDTADACTASDTDGTSCDDGSFCNGADTCAAGACSVHPGDPCDGADGDGDCSETCDDAVGACTGLDPAGSTCSDGLACTLIDTCNAAGTCVGNPATNPCTGGTVDADCDCTEACAEDPLAPQGFSCTGPNTASTLCGPSTVPPTFCNGTGACNSPTCAQPLVMNQVQAADLVVTEIMYNPDICLDTSCEWIEVRNATGADVNLNGLLIQDAGPSSCTVTTTFVLAAGAYAWVAVTPGSSWTYTMQPDVFCTGSVSLNNSGAESVILRNGAGTVIDQTSYTAASVGVGRSLKLNPAGQSAAANDVAANWCYSTVAFDTVDLVSDYGSPRALNEAACAP